MNNYNSTLKKQIVISERGKTLEKYEDPLVCKLCGNNNILTLYSTQNIYCFNCGSEQKLLNKEKTPAKEKCRPIGYWKRRFESWKKGKNLTKQELEQLKESIYAKEFFDNLERKQELLNLCEKMEVTVIE